MIKNDEQLERTRRAVTKLESGLAALKREVYHLNPRRFAVMAEPVIDQIQTLRREVDEYLGITGPTSEFSLPESDAERMTITLAPDVAAAFLTAEAVNEALRRTMREMQAAA